MCASCCVGALIADFRSEGLGENGLGDFSVGELEHFVKEVGGGVFIIDFEGIDFLVGIDNGHGVLEHIGKHVEDFGTAFVGGIFRNFTDDPGDSVLFHVQHPESGSRAFEGNGPEAAGQESFAVWVFEAWEVSSDDEFPFWENDPVGFALCEKAELVFGVEFEPIIRALFDDVWDDPFSIEFPHDFES